MPWSTKRLHSGPKDRRVVSRWVAVVRTATQFPGSLLRSQSVCTKVCTRHLVSGQYPRAVDEVKNV